MDDLDRIKGVLSEVNYPNCFIEASIESEMVRIIVSLRADCVDNGQKTVISAPCIYVPLTASTDVVVSRVYSGLRDLILHELDEAFLYKGERIYFPHLLVEDRVEIQIRKRTTPVRA